VVTLEGDKFTDQALNLMKERDVRSITCLARRRIGIVSKTDILLKVMSQGRNSGKVRLREIMTSPVLAVDPHNTDDQETLSIPDKHLIRKVMSAPVQ
jgi:CBS domain-containing protein